MKDGRLGKSEGCRSSKVSLFYDSPQSVKEAPMSHDEPYCYTSLELPADLQNALDGVGYLAHATAARVGTIESATIQNGVSDFLVKTRSEIKAYVAKHLPEIIAGRRGRPVKVGGNYFPSAHDAVLHYAWSPGSLRNPDKLLAECKAESIRAAAVRKLKGSSKKRDYPSNVPTDSGSQTNPSSVSPRPAMRQDGEEEGNKIWLDGKLYTMADGLRKLLAFLLQNNGATEEQVMHHCGFNGKSHLHKRLSDLRVWLGNKLRRAPRSLRIKTEYGRISHGWFSRQ
jgi:hypothetical protein